MTEVHRPEANPNAALDAAQANLFKSIAARDALIDRIVFSVDGAHPFHSSVESQTHWNNMTDIVGVRRMAERASIAETELVTDTLTPLFENGTPRFLDRIGKALNAAAKPALVLETAVGGTAVAAVITIVQPDVPAAQANNGFLVEAGGTNPTAECVKDNLDLDNPFSDNPDDKRPFIVETSDPVFAEKLARGEVVIAAGPPPIAALEEGDKTAAAIPGISVEEAIKNLIAPAPPCEPKKPPVDSVRHTAQNLKDAPYPEKPNNPQAIKKQQAELLKKLRADLEKAFEGDPYPEITSVVFPKSFAQKSVNTCLKATTAISPTNSLRRSSCKDVIYGALDMHLMTRDPKFYQLALDMRDLAVIRLGNAYKNSLYADMVNRYPPGWIPKLSDY